MQGKVSDSVFGGTVLITAGTILLLNSFFGWALLWPLLLAIPICALILSYLDNHQKGMVIPITIIGVIMILFLTMSTGLLRWSDLSWLWPTFILAPGLGLLFFYLLSHDKGILVAAIIIVCLFVIFISGAGVYWPLIFIIIGISIIVVSRNRRHRRK